MSDLTWLLTNLNYILGNTTVLCLFNTQVGLAVGDIQKERDKAVFIEFNLQVITL